MPYGPQDYRSNRGVGRPGNPNGAGGGGYSPSGGYGQGYVYDGGISAPLGGGSSMYRYDSSNNRGVPHVSSKRVDNERVDPGMINWERVYANPISARSVSAFDVEGDAMAQRRGSRAFNDVVGSARRAGDDFQRSTGLGAGTAGGAAQASLLRTLGGARGAEARDNVLQDERVFRTGIDERNADRDFQASSANQAARLNAALANQSTGFNASRARSDIEVGNANRALSAGQSNASNALQAALANQSSALQRANLSSADQREFLQYDLGLRELAERARQGDMNAALAYDQLSEEARQFSSRLGFDYDQLQEDTRRFDTDNRYRYDVLGDDRERFDLQFGEDNRRFDVDNQFRYDTLGDDRDRWATTFNYQREQEMNDRMDRTFDSIRNRSSVANSQRPSASSSAGLEQLWLSRAQNEAERQRRHEMEMLMWQLAPGNLIAWELPRQLGYDTRPSSPTPGSPFTRASQIA